MSEVCVWGLCHVCEKVVTGSKRPPGCFALTGIKGYGRYYCRNVGCPDHPVQDYLCEEHKDFDPHRVEFYCLGPDGFMGNHTADQLGWCKPSPSNPLPQKK